MDELVVKRLLSYEMNSASQTQTRDESFFSLLTNVLEEGMKPSVLPPPMGKGKLGSLTDQEEG